MILRDADTLLFYPSQRRTLTAAEWEQVRDMIRPGEEREIRQTALCPAGFFDFGNGPVYCNHDTYARLRFTVDLLQGSPEAG